MKRFHVHLHVDNLSQSIGFYSRLFAAEPARQEADYAKWMLQDPPVNFAISTRGARPGIDHLGIQTDDEAELVALKARAQAADLALQDEGVTTCCYARSDKYWVTDPQGVAWEHFHTLASIPVFNEAAAQAQPAGACCTPAAVAAPAVSAAEAAPATATTTAAGNCCTPSPRSPGGKPIGIAVKGASSCC